MTRRSLQQGVGLVEIMVAVVIGLMLMAGMLRIYLGTKQSYQMQDSLTQRQESARFAAHLLMSEAQMAGFRGCLHDSGTVVNTLNDAGDFLYDFGRHVQGFDAEDDDWQPSLPGAITNPDPVPGTDVLTLRSIADPQVFITENMASNSADPKTVEDPATPLLAAGDIVLISDCGGAAIFQVSNYTMADGTIMHDTGTSVVPGNATQDLGRRYPTGSQIFRLSTTSYFIANSTSGSGPALWRQVDADAPQELAAGVENFQVQYGEDTDADQVADVWRNAGAVGSWTNIVALRMALLVAGVRDRVSPADPREFTLLDQVIGPFDDGRLRRVLNFTVALRNRLS